MRRAEARVERIDEPEGRTDVLQFPYRGEIGMVRVRMGVVRYRGATDPPYGQTEVLC